jgi:hypothetical protein
VGERELSRTFCAVHHVVDAGTCENSIAGFWWACNRICLGFITFYIAKRYNREEQAWCNNSILDAVISVLVKERSCEVIVSGPKEV